MRPCATAVLAFALFACGGTQESPPAMTAEPANAPETEAEASSARAFPIELETATGVAQVRGIAGRVFLGPHGRFQLPLPCIDLLAIVREGEVRVRPRTMEEMPRRLHAGDAVRVAPDSVIENVGPGTALLVVGMFTDGERFSVERFSTEGVLGVDVAPCDGVPAHDMVAEPAGPFPVAGGALRATLLFDGANARYASLGLLDADPTAAVPEHVHEASAEILFIEEGHGLMKIGDREIEVRPGLSIYVPPNTPHDFRPAGDTPLRAIQMYAPPGPEQRFRPATETP